MHALPHRRQPHSNAFHQQPQPTFPSPPSSQSFNFTGLPLLPSANPTFDQKLLNDYLESQQLSFATGAFGPDTTLDPYMNNGGFDYPNPAIRVQQSTPQPSTFAHTSMALPAQNQNSWNNAPMSSQTLQTPKTNNSKTHQRNSSASSIASDASAAASYRSYVAYPENSPSQVAAEADSIHRAGDSSRPFSNHLPTPSQTPTQDSFGNNTNGFGSSYAGGVSGMGMDPMNAHFAMKQALMEQTNYDDEVPGFASARHSVSDYGHDSPATPLTANDELDERFKMAPHGETLRRVDSWLFNEFLTYDDDADMRQNNNMPTLDGSSLYDMNVNGMSGTSMTQGQSQTMAQAKPNPQLLSPFHGTGNGRAPNANLQRMIQMANSTRGQSPAGSGSGAVSPFRHNSPYMSSTGSPRVRVGTAAEAREQRLEEESAHAMKGTLRREETKTMSPQDALLEFHDTDEDSKVTGPLFPDGGASDFSSQYAGGNTFGSATQSGIDTTTSGGQSFASNGWTTQPFAAGNFGTSVSSQPTFAAPAIPGNPHSLPFSAASQYRPTSTMASASDVLDFPATLATMESSASEAEPHNSQTSQGSLAPPPLQKPTSSAAETGTYTCTYHGCTLRFETPQKLQKHKREGHRNVAHGPVGSNMSSAQLLERNSQAGPHKCERINPTTGKPCNTIFSRPYDLTRHEDTIHNARKQKVRCALCTEEKTFSRNDALTRHMVRVHRVFRPVTLANTDAACRAS